MVDKEDTSNELHNIVSRCYWDVYKCFIATESPPKISSLGQQSINSLGFSVFCWQSRLLCRARFAIKSFTRLKFIILMRDPVTRVYSSYLFVCSQRFGPNPANWPEEFHLHTAETFLNLIVTDVKEFNECLDSSSLYECTNNMTSKFQALTGKDICGFISH